MCGGNSTEGSNPSLSAEFAQLAGSELAHPAGAGPPPGPPWCVGGTPPWPVTGGENDKAEGFTGELDAHAAETALPDEAAEAAPEREKPDNELDDADDPTDEESDE